MPHGPCHFPSKGACIYCGSTRGLTDEHVVPYSLGGQHVIRAGSCRECADITKKFEQKVARDLWGTARASFGAPTRRKRERKMHVVMQDPTDPKNTIEVPVADYPAGMVFYVMPKAGLLQGLPESVDLSSFWSLIVIDDQERREKFLSKNNNKLSIKFRNVPGDFARMIAKIGYCQVLTTLNLDDFEPLCIPYIKGEKDNHSYVVGGSSEKQIPVPDVGYELNTVAIGNALMLLVVATVRLFSNTAAPAYHVVVGFVRGVEKVERLKSKLQLSSSPSYGAHFLPSVFPLPFWTTAF